MLNFCFVVAFHVPVSKPLCFNSKIEKMDNVQHTSAYFQSASMYSIKSLNCTKNKVVRPNLTPCSRLHLGALIVA